jgi:hypothetical protein
MDFLSALSLRGSLTQLDGGSLRQLLPHGVFDERSRRGCGVIGILLSLRRYRAADQSECDGRQHECVLSWGLLNA